MNFLTYSMGVNQKDPSIPKVAENMDESAEMDLTDASRSPSSSIWFCSIRAVCWSGGVIKLITIVF